MNNLGLKNIAKAISLSYLQTNIKKLNELMGEYGEIIVKRAQGLAFISPYSLDDCIHFALMTPDDELIKKAFLCASRSHSGVCSWLRMLIGNKAISEAIFEPLKIAESRLKNNNPQVVTIASSPKSPRAEEFIEKMLENCNKAFGIDSKFIGEIVDETATEAQAKGRQYTIWSGVVGVKPLRPTFKPAFIVYDEIDEYPSLEWQLRQTKGKARRKIRRKMRKRNKLNKKMNDRNRRDYLDALAYAGMAERIIKENV